MSTLRRVGDAASIVRERNCGTKPRLTSAMPPFFMKTRREIMVRPLFPLKLGGSEDQRRGLPSVLRLSDRLRRRRRDVAGEHAVHELIASGAGGIDRQTRRLD